FAMALGQSSILIDTSTAITSVNSAIEGSLTNEDIGAEDLDIDLSAIQLSGLEIGVGLNPGFEEAGKGQIGGAGWYMVDSGDVAAAVVGREARQGRPAGEAADRAGRREHEARHQELAEQQAAPGGAVQGAVDRRDDLGAHLREPGGARDPLEDRSQRALDECRHRFLL